MSLFNRFAPAALCLAILSLALFFCCSPTCGKPGQQVILTAQGEDTLVAAAAYKRLPCGGPVPGKPNLIASFDANAEIRYNRQYPAYVLSGTLYERSSLPSGKRNNSFQPYGKGQFLVFNTDGSVLSSTPPPQIPHQRFRCGGKCKGWPDVMCDIRMDRSHDTNPDGYLRSGTLFASKTLTFGDRKKGPKRTYKKDTFVTFNSDGSVASVVPPK